MQAYYHSTETFGTVDGRGIRYVLFLSGCGLACKFCHNRDSWQTTEATISIEQVLTHYNRYRAYYEAAKGGITVSGGEPLLQAEFVTELFRRCRLDGIHTTLDTAGHAAAESLAKVSSYADAILYGLKAINNSVHRQLTGASNRAILDNLRWLADKTAVTVRYIIIPDINDSKRDIGKLALYLQSLTVTPKVELLPYHNAGQYKWQQMGHAYPLEGIREAGVEDINHARLELTQRGIVVL
ncbi:pyruvate formate-lyase-activating protein [Anaerospora sp.]|uniref:pyruvate formate-lyase-activating protein n=1 Tax=Anaerospora sp. TaxID=1960278 RepID=UPI0028985D8F|nr:pyruvate formate-lyase-activating protein [Anaerospora sp.]